MSTRTAASRVGIGRIGVDYVVASGIGAQVNANRSTYGDSCVDCGAPFRGRKRKRCAECLFDRKADQQRARYEQRAAAQGRAVQVRRCGACGEHGHNAQRCPEDRRSAIHAAVG